MIMDKPIGEYRSLEITLDGAREQIEMLKSTLEDISEQIKQLESMEDELLAKMDRVWTHDLSEEDREILSNPTHLANMIVAEKFTPIDLANAIEKLGKVTSDLDLIESAVEKHLDHNNDYVREAAILVLDKRRVGRIALKISKMSLEDPSIRVRSVAKDFVDKFWNICGK